MMITVQTLKQLKSKQEKITMLTCYDASFASLLDHCGVEILLVGDSLGMVVQGKKSTLPVSLENMCYHTHCVAQGAQNALILADLPFGSYEESKEKAFYSATQLMKKGANMVKIEGGTYQAETVAFLKQRSIPVCAHIGLTPQAVNTLGGYKVQGKEDEQAMQLIKDAIAHDKAGASLIVMECVPNALAAEITNTVSCPTIGIGAGVACDGQVLVLQDMLGIYRGKKAKFVKNFMQGQDSIEGAIKSYINAVKQQSYPDDAHSFH